MSVGFVVDGGRRPGTGRLLAARVLAGLALIGAPFGAWAEQDSGGSRVVQVRTPAVLEQPAASAALLAGWIDAAPVIDAGLAEGGVLLPCGRYRLDRAPAAVSQAAPVLRGAGRGCVSFLVGFGAGDVIRLGEMGAAGLGVRGSRVGGFTLVATVPRFSGAGIAVGTHHDSVVEDVAFEGPWGDQVRVQGNGGTSALTTIRDFRLGTVSGTTSGACIRLVGYANDTRIEDGSMSRCGQGIVVGSASGVVLGRLDVFGSVGAGVSVAPSAAAGENVNAVFTAGPVWSDTSGGNGWEFVGDGAVSDVHLDAAWGAGSGSTIGADGSVAVTVPGFGLVVSNPRVDGLVVGGGSQFHGNGASGIALLAGRNLVIGSGVQVWNNGAVDAVVEAGAARCRAARFDGIALLAPATGITVMAVQSGRGGYLGGALGRPSCQRFGVFAGEGTDEERAVTVMGVQAFGNALGGVRLPAGRGMVGVGNLP